MRKGTAGFHPCGIEKPDGADAETKNQKNHANKTNRTTAKPFPWGDPDLITIMP
jgi:hypothetical protein